MLEAIQLECARGFRTLFTGLDFALQPGELLLVAGTNGSGKTSLLRILCGLLTPDAGEIRWKGRDVRALSEDYRRELLYVGHASGVKEELTPVENLRIACTLGGTKATDKVLAGALAAFGLLGFENAPVKALSQGQRRRAVLARLALGDEYPLWLLDEPLNALDKSATSQVERSIGRHLERGGMVVMATHQPVATLAGVTRTIELDGCVV